MEFLNTLKTLIIVEIEEGNEEIVLHMVEQYPPLLDFSNEFLNYVSPDLSRIHSLFSSHQRYNVSGLYAHCLQCQHKQKIKQINNWNCEECFKNNTILN